MADAYTDLMLAHKLEEMKAELAAVAGQPGPPGPAGPQGPEGAAAGDGGVYLLPAISGGYIIVNPGASSTNLYTAGVAFLWPIWLPEPIDITEFGVNANTGSAGATVHLGLYSFSEGNLQLETNFGSFDASTAGNKTFVGNWTLPGGVWWVGIVAAGAGAQLRTTTLLNAVGPYPIPNSTFSSDTRCLTYSTGLTGLPATVPFTGLSSISPPVRLLAKRA